MRGPKFKGYKEHNKKHQETGGALWDMEMGYGKRERYVEGRKREVKGPGCDPPVCCLHDDCVYDALLTHTNQHLWQKITEGRDMKTPPV